MEVSCFHNLAASEEGFCMNFHPCLASNAKLKPYKSLSPNLPSPLGLHIFLQLTQCIFSFPASCPTKTRQQFYITLHKGFWAEEICALCRLVPLGPPFLSKFHCQHCSANFLATHIASSIVYLSNTQA